MIKVSCTEPSINEITIGNLKAQLPTLVKSSLTGNILLVTLFDEMNAEAEAFVVAPALTSSTKVGSFVMINVLSGDYRYHYGRVSLETSR